MASAVRMGLEMDWLLYGGAGGELGDVLNCWMPWAGEQPTACTCDEVPAWDVKFEEAAIDIAKDPIEVKEECLMVSDVFPDEPATSANGGSDAANATEEAFYRELEGYPDGSGNSTNSSFTTSTLLKTISLEEKRKFEEIMFPKEALADISGTTSSKAKHMTSEQRALVLYKRKLRNRESARRSRQRRFEQSKHRSMYRYHEVQPRLVPILMKAEPQPVHSYKMDSVPVKAELTPCDPLMENITAGDLSRMDPTAAA
mmetsp:Transcript_3531/g.10659  ORF Transcript_3531/g.10659 Transcript_3531/m.10659 type:complete len:257 (+) Transcript_3531:168-938(+)